MWLMYLFACDLQFIGNTDTNKDDVFTRDWTWCLNLLVSSQHEFGGGGVCVCVV